MAVVDPDSIKTHVCLLGLSYIRRLSDIMISNKNLLNINLDDDRYKISVCVRGGLIRDVAGTPTIFIMQIGGTDIGLLPNQIIATNIVLFSEYLIYGLGTRMVIIGQLLRRDPSVSVLVQR